MTRPLLLVLLLCGISSAHAESTGGVFERFAEGGGGGAWRSRGAGPNMLVLAEGFAVRRGDRIQRFRWAPSLRLQSLVAEQPVASPTYVLSGPRAGGRSLPQAERVRAVSSDRTLSIVYRFGGRGLEFDIELEPGARLPVLRLEAADGDFSVNRDGHLTAGGDLLALKPVAYNVDGAGRRHIIPATYRLKQRRQVTIEIGRYNSNQRLVIDPVLTYATYFAGSGDDSPIAVRELQDGSVLLAGNTRSMDLPFGVSLNTVLMEPSGLYMNRQCFVARVSPATRQIHFVSYFGGIRFASCTSMDMDSSGRILLAGVSDGSPALTTPDAQYRTARYTVEPFLARVSADGRKLEYSTFLNLDCQNAPLFMRAGPAETAYIFSQCAESIGSRSDALLLLRYDIAGKRIDQRATFADRMGLHGMERAASGAIYAFGGTASRTMPLRDPVQGFPATEGKSAGFVAAFSADFSLLFSSYLGGQNGFTSIHSVLPNADGSVWLAGTAYEGSIPGLQSLRPFPPGRIDAPFAVQVFPGDIVFRKAFFAGGFDLDTLGSILSLALADGRYCFAAYGPVSESSPGAAAAGSSGGAPLLACLNDTGDNIQFLTPVGTGSHVYGPGPLAPSRSGGVWSLNIATGGDVVPFELKATAIQPFRPLIPGSSSTDDLVLRHIDLRTPNPALSHPQVMHLFALRGNTAHTVDLAGRNFAQGMYLEIDGRQFPLTALNPYAATLSYKSPSLTISGVTLGLRAGTYSGRLVIPVEPPAASESFPVVVNNLPPALQPFSPAIDPRTFNVAAPVYDESQVLWNGQPLPFSPTNTEGNFQVQIPAEVALDTVGEFVLTNPRPGGGIQRQRVRVGAGAPVPGVGVALQRIAAELFQVDRSRQLLYTVTRSGATQWAISCYNLPAADLVETLTIPRESAAAIVDFKLSRDGALLYAVDNLLRVTRFRTAPLTQDLQFQVPTDAPPVFTNMPERRHSLRILNDSSESVLVATPAGRLILYDGDQPRPYSTSDFPSSVIKAMDPVLATSSYVYAVRRADVYDPVPCVVRYAVDGLGFFSPEEFCDFAASWGKYPEMKVYTGALVLENADGAFGIRLRPTTSGSMRFSNDYHPDRNVSSATTALTFNQNTRIATYRLTFSRMDTGEPIGHFPPATALMDFPGSVVFLDDDTMLYFEQIISGGGWVAIVPQWQNAIERYP